MATTDNLPTIRLSSVAPLKGAKRWAFLERAPTIRVATQSGDEPIYLSPLWYVVRDRKIYLPLDQASRHGTNLDRGGRLSAVVDVGEEFGVMIGVIFEGTAVAVDDPGLVEELHELVVQKYFYTDHPYLEEYVNFGRYKKRAFYEVVPERTISWDFREAAVVPVHEARYFPDDVA